MTTPTPAGAIWPARHAYTAAGIFAAASIGTNFIYGWQKGTDLGGSLVWAAVSVVVSIVFSLSCPAFLRCLDTKQWSRAVMVLVALMITGAYSVTTALGSAMGGRANAAMAEKDAGNRRARAQTAYDRAQAELASLATAKPAAEWERFLEATKAELDKLPASRSIAELESLIRRGCGSPIALAGHVRSACPKYDAERGPGSVSG